MDAPTTVFIVDDHPGYRSVAGAVVEAADGFQLAGMTDSADHAVDAILATEPRPDLVLMDVNLGDGNGIEVTRALLARSPATRVVLVSTLALEDLPATAARCGASGYLPKSTLSPATLEQVNAGTYDWRP